MRIDRRDVEGDASSAPSLDDPIWASLDGPHAAVAEGDGLARRYPSTFAPFGAMRRATPDAYEALSTLVPRGGQVALFTTDALVPPPRFKVVSARELIQMVAGGEVGEPGDRSAVVTLDVGDAPDMARLAELTKPGPFGPRTRELGAYLGIRVDGELAAMAGERLRFGGHVEVSAVCVHPLHRGRGFADLLVSTLAEVATNRGELPFPHVFTDNAPALRLYERLGFTVRRRLLATRLLRVPE